MTHDTKDSNELSAQDTTQQELRDKFKSIALQSKSDGVDTLLTVWESNLVKACHAEVRACLERLKSEIEPSDDSVNMWVTTTIEAELKKYGGDR